MKGLAARFFQTAAQHGRSRQIHILHLSLGIKPQHAGLHAV